MIDHSLRSLPDAVHFLKSLAYSWVGDETYTFKDFDRLLVLVSLKYLQLYDNVHVLNRRLQNYFEAGFRILV